MKMEYLLAVLSSTGLFYWRSFLVLAYGQHMYVMYDWEIVCAMHKWIDMLVKHYVCNEFVISTCVEYKYEDNERNMINVM